MGFKENVRRRMALRWYPRRSAAVFTDENDHNPQVLQDCPECDGTGTQCHHNVTSSGEEYATGECTPCNGTGVTGEIEPCFPDDMPEMAACADDMGWITCPDCDWRFALRDKNAWTGRRHLKCGRKIRIVDAKPF